MTPNQPLSRLERWERLLYVAIALTPFTVLLLLSYGVSLPLPGCPLMRFIGVPCPGWGLTRSFLAMAHGDWQQAIAFHAFGPVIAIGFIWAGTHCLLELARGYRISTPWGVYFRKPRFQVGLFLVLLGYHATRLYALGQAGLLFK